MFQLPFKNKHNNRSCSKKNFQEKRQDRDFTIVATQFSTFKSYKAQLNLLATYLKVVIASALKKYQFSDLKNLLWISVGI